jgi:hypothetical protein
MHSGPLRIAKYHDGNSAVFQVLLVLDIFCPRKAGGRTPLPPITQRSTPRTGLAIQINYPFRNMVG